MPWSHQFHGTEATVPYGGTNRLLAPSCHFPDPYQPLVYRQIGQKTFFRRRLFPDFGRFLWFFCNLVEEYMFHYEFPLQQFDTSSSIHYSFDSLQLVDVTLGYSVGDV